MIERSKRAKELARGLRRLSVVSRTEVTKQCTGGHSEGRISDPERSEKPQLGEVFKITEILSFFSLKKFDGVFIKTR